MPAYWLMFAGRPAGCVEADNETDANRIAREITGHEPVSCAHLPYPANPRLKVHGSIVLLHAGTVQWSRVPPQAPCLRRPIPIACGR